ncbi:hypothetical protein AN1V17_27750 [Vallitalea sediminicola]
MKKIFMLTCFILVLCINTVAYAAHIEDNDKLTKNKLSTAIDVISFDNGISFALFKDENINNINHSIKTTGTKEFTEDSYDGYFYYTETTDKISKHNFTAKFSYDNTMASCYETDSSVKMIDDDAPYRPKAENEGRNNLTPTNVYGHVTFTLYNDDDTVNNSVIIKIFCNQKGETNVKRYY